MNPWLIEEKRYTPKDELFRETVFTLANGYMATRGTLEEGHAVPEVRSYFGTYVAGIFDKYSKNYQAIVNLPDFFASTLAVSGETMKMNAGKVADYRRVLDMKEGTLSRCLTWTNSRGQSTAVAITRFISKADPHLAVLRYRLTPLNYSGEVTLESVLDSRVTNIDFHISGYQLRDEKYHFIDERVDTSALPRGGSMTVRTRTTKHAICEAFQVQSFTEGRAVASRSTTCRDARTLAHTCRLKVARGRVYDLVKTVAVYTSNDGLKNLTAAATAKVKAAETAGYEKLLAAHTAAWHKAWETSDIAIAGNARDEQAVRFNLYHVIQMGNKENPRVNIGSRGLTSEMHYGNCFWDTELFIMPFFIYADPETARALVKYRYLTLETAREKAKKLWFKGAMYPWMSSWPGHEQADYWEYANIAVHIVSDVAYGLMHYYKATGDTRFMLDCGLEMLIETARFWASRVDWNERRNGYAINLVKGPNEYAITNNNTYTNWSARWNLEAAVEILSWAKRRHPRELAKVARKVKLSAQEPKDWAKIAAKIVINHDAKRDLYIEDDTFLDKPTVDLKKLKPGKAISTEMGWTWDTIIRHRVVKQADVLLLMYLHRDGFSRKQLQRAWDFYEPLTLHDSSLSYNTHCIVASELGEMKKSYEYFQQTVRLDLDDVMANVFLGIHSANAGGAWQCVANGFCGMRVTADGVSFTPHLPPSWREVTFRFFYQGHRFKVAVCAQQARIELEQVDPQGAPVAIKGNRIFVGKDR